MRDAYAIPHLRLADAPTRLDHHIDAFLRAKSLKSPKTLAFYELGLRLYKQYAGPIWPPTDESISGFLASTKARGCADATVHAYYRAVRTWCNWLTARGKLDDNPIHLVDKPRKPRRLPRAPRAANLVEIGRASCRERV